jgi:predicted deacetylase
MKQLRKRLLILRFDDICPTMQWDTWSKIEAALIENNVKPILAVVPDNQDPVLQVAPPVDDFWHRVRRWQGLGWTIALHGYQHLYVAKAGGLVTRRKKSEFASLSASVQEEKLRRGMEIFAREGIKTRVWIAPGNAFDETTVSLLPKFGIDIVSAGWFWGPFLGPHQTIWMPCQLSILRSVPSGVWTAYYHHNSWERSDLGRFLKRLKKYRDQVVSLEDALAQSPPSRASWCYHFCTSPRLSALVMRAQLKIWRHLHPENDEFNNSDPSDGHPWSSNVLRSGTAR